MVLPNGLLAFYYGWRGNPEVVYTSQVGDGHISMGMPVTVEGTFSTSQIHGKMNGGGQALVIHTGDGSIRLNKIS